MPPSKWELTHKEYRCEYKRQYRLIHREGIAAYNRDYQKSYQPVHRAAHPEQYKARTAANHAIERGRLVRQVCEVCGKSNAHAHHEDYSRFLEVTWLCPVHHRERHAQVD